MNLTDPYKVVILTTMSVDTVMSTTTQVSSESRSQYKAKAYSAASAESPLAPMTIPRRDPGEDDVQIEILFCGICHSDLHTVRSEWSAVPTVYPCVPGHEIVGRVTKVGSGVTKFNQYTFLDYLIQVQKKFRKLILLIDRARQHHRSIMVREYIKQNKDVLKVIYFPKGSSEFNAIEECWRQGKYNLLVSKYYPKFVNLKCYIQLL
jgi:hypothetical protein